MRRPSRPFTFVAENDVTDAEGYKTQYLPPGSIKAHGGRYLAAGTVTAFAGEPPKSRVVIRVWGSMEQLQGWFTSLRSPIATRHAEYDPPVGCAAGGRGL